MQAGDAIGASGMVQAGTLPTIRVAGAADLVRLGDLGEALPLSADVTPPAIGTDEGGGPLTSDGPDTSPSPATVARDGSREASSIPLTAGIGSIGALAIAWTTLLLVRRRRDRRLVRGRIERRVAEVGAPFTGASTAAATPEPSQPESSSVRSAPIVRESA